MFIDSITCTVFVGYECGAVFAGESNRVGVVGNSRQCSSNGSVSKLDNEAHCKSQYAKSTVAADSRWSKMDEERVATKCVGRSLA